MYYNRIEPVEYLLVVRAFVILNFGGPETVFLFTGSDEWLKVEIFRECDEIINLFQRAKDGNRGAGDLLKAF